MNSCKFKAGNAAYRNKLSSCLWLYHKWQRIHPLLCIQYPANVSEEFFAVFQQKKIQNPKTKLNTVRNRSYLFAEIRPPRTAVQSFSETKLSTSQTQSYIFFTSLNFTTKYSRFCMSIFSSRHFGFGAYSSAICCSEHLFPFGWCWAFFINIIFGGRQHRKNLKHINMYAIMHALCTSGTKWAIYLCSISFNEVMDARCTSQLQKPTTWEMKKHQTRRTIFLEAILTFSWFIRFSFCCSSSSLINY